MFNPSMFNRFFISSLLFSALLGVIVTSLVLPPPVCMNDSHCSVAGASYGTCNLELGLCTCMHGRYDSLCSTRPVFSLQPEIIGHTNDKTYAPNDVIDINYNFISGNQGRVYVDMQTWSTSTSAWVRTRTLSEYTVNQPNENSIPTTSVVIPEGTDDIVRFRFSFDGFSFGFVYTPLIQVIEPFS